MSRQLLAAVLMAGSCTMAPDSAVTHQPRQKLQPAKTSSSRRGRPRKFSRPSRAVNLTLPDDVIAALKGLDADLSRAIVRATETLAPQPGIPLVRQPDIRQPDIQGAELTPYGNRAVIVVPGRLDRLEALGAELVKLADGRALISFDDAQGIPQFELRLMDALADPELDEEDRAALSSLAEILRSARRADGPELRQRRIIVLQWGDQAQATV